MLLEVVQGEGGVIPAPLEWLCEIRRITRERGIPLIVDEVQTGWGRTGTLYAFEAADILPDAVVLSKAIGGSFPLAVVVYHKDLDCWKPGAHAGTFRGNQLAMAAGLATLRFIQEQRLERHAAEMGKRLLQHLRGLQGMALCLGEVRGRGLMVGVEIVDAEAVPDALGTCPAAPAVARRIQAEALRRGLILELGGRHDSVVRFLPPLIVTAEQVDQIAEIFGEAVLDAQGRPVDQIRARV
jgi:diaminobutyrate-2-oxoglutarate transaminase